MLTLSLTRTAVIFDEIARSTEDFNGAQVKAVRVTHALIIVSDTAPLICCGGCWL
jgi:ATP-dependent 26S proteasome regulatory subunit